jgi:phosphohistidine phosphatase
MKALFLVRHAKSSWDQPALADVDRPLSHRGERAARRIADHIARAGIRPALVLCSPARRARATLDAMAASLGKQAMVRISERLYGVDADDLLAILRETPPSTPSVMLIGHNPALHDLALDLTGEGDDLAVSRLRTKFPTAALATLLFPAEAWPSLGAGSAYLESLVLPRELGDP